MYDGLDALVKFLRHNYGEQYVEPTSSFGSQTTADVMSVDLTTDITKLTFSVSASNSPTSTLHRRPARPVHPEIRRMLLLELESAREEIFQKHLYKPRTRKGPSLIMTIDAINNLVDHWTTVSSLEEFNERLQWKEKWATQYGEELYARLRKLERERKVESTRREFVARKRKSLGREREEEVSSDEPEMVAETTPRKRIKAFTPRVVRRIVSEECRNDIVGGLGVVKRTTRGRSESGTMKLREDFARNLSLSDADSRPGSENGDGGLLDWQRQTMRPIYTDATLEDDKSNRSWFGSFRSRKKRQITRIIWDSVDDCTMVQATNALSQTDDTFFSSSSSSKDSSPLFGSLPTPLRTDRFSHGIGATGPRYETSLHSLAQRCRVSVTTLRHFFLFLQCSITHTPWRFSTTALSPSDTAFTQSYYKLTLEPILSLDESRNTTAICYAAEKPGRLFLHVADMTLAVADLGVRSLCDAVDLLKDYDLERGGADAVDALGVYGGRHDDERKKTLEKMRGRAWTVADDVE